jgi:hypothetical protein
MRFFALILLATVPAQVGAFDGTQSRVAHPSFRNDVIPVLARLGCSAGACHGANSGKGGFKLSLRGYAPELDYIAIARHYGGRRISREAPERSLLLRKPLLEVAHGGGPVLRRGSKEHQTILAWLQHGAPPLDEKEPRLLSIQVAPSSLLLVPSVRAGHRAPGTGHRLTVRATFSDGRVADVTARALFRSNDVAVAPVTDAGEVTARSAGATAIQAKYMDALAVVHVTVPFGETGLRTRKRELRRTENAKARKDENAKGGLADRVDVSSGDPFVSRFPAFAFSRSQSGLPAGGHNANDSSADLIDAAVRARLRELNLEPSPPCTDAEFLRRVFIDALGTLPTADEARTFLDSRDPAKRAKQIDTVLQRPEYALVWAMKLSDLFLMRREHMGRKNTLALHQWLIEQFQQNRPWDRIATDLLTAAGPTRDNAPALWWISRQDVRPNHRGWIRSAPLTAEVTAQVFLGTRIQCAKCHNHPTERYTQDDYYRLAACFSQVNGEGGGEVLPEKLVTKDAGEIRHPRTNEVMPARPIDRSPMPAGEGEDRRIAFTRWLTQGAGREPFAWAMVNRVWARLFGAGIVEPVDDMRATNSPRNPALMNLLARQFMAGGYDMKRLIATIMKSQTYQASSTPTRRNAIDTQFFSHYPARRLPAEEMLDALAQVTGVPDKFATYPLGTRAMELSDIELASLALDTFGRPPRVMPSDGERCNTPSISQALDLINGEALQNKLKHPEGTIATLLKGGKPDAAIIEELFLMTFARRPTPKERADTARIIAQAPNREEGLQDVLWALVNSKEFMFQH